MTTTTVATDRIDAGPNDRQAFDQDGLEELAASIRDHGLAQPPTLRPVGERFEIVAGERRVRAIRLLGWSEVPCFVRELTDEQASAVMLCENVQRTDLDPMEEARAYQSRMERFGCSQADVAALANVPLERVRRRVALLQLDPEIQHLVSRKLLPLGHAAAMTPLDSNRQRLAIRAYQSQPMTLDTLRALCNRLYSEQQQDSIFDADSFLQVADYVADAESAVEEDATLEGEVKEPVGLSEIADRLRVKKETVDMWRFRTKEGTLPVPMPEPRWIISGTPIWEWVDIMRWDKRRQSKSA